jgi:outer membrane protein assembly factor BamB
VNEPFDVEISRALKKDTAESLQGWEFTPAMQAKVMQRIRAEAASDSAADEPPAPPARRRNLVDWARPLSLVAAAAAALVLAVNVNWSGGFGASSRESAATTDSAPPAEMAKTVPSGDKADNLELKTTQQGVVPPVTPPAIDNSSNGAAANAVAIGSRPSNERAESLAFALPIPAPAHQDAALTDTFRALTAPPGLGKMAGATDPTPTVEPTDPTPPADGGELEFNMATIAAVENVSGAVAEGGAVFTLTTTGLNYTSADMATVRDVSLEELGFGSTVAVAADGKAAVVGTGNRVYLIDTDGTLMRTIARSEAIERVRWSTDGRLAVAEGKRIVVYRADSGEAQFEVATGGPAEIAFTPSGYLAVFARRPDGAPELALMDAKGTEVARLVQPAEAGSGLTVAAGGRVVVAGGHAYSATWRSIWELPMKTSGVTALGDEWVVGWNDKTVLNANVTDGKPVWEANWDGTGRITRVVASSGGKLMAILAETEEGPVLWVVEAGGKVRLTERLEQVPVEIGLSGDQVVMILPTAVQYRAIPE